MQDEALETWLAGRSTYATRAQGINHAPVPEVADL
jgi:hypothetical protein